MLKRTKFPARAVILLMALCIISCTPEEKKQKTISISGAFALYPLVIQWAGAYEAGHPGTRFNISAGGAGKGMADALSGAVDLGMFSRAISQAEIDKGVWWVGLSIDAVLPTISSENPCLDILLERGLSREEFADIFMSGKLNKWDDITGKHDGQHIRVYTRADACGAAGTWAEYLGGKQENLQGIGIYGDPGLAEAVTADPLGMGFNNTIFIYDIKSGTKRSGIEVIPIDLNGNGRIDPEEDFYDTFDEILDAIGRGAYPSPPARELYFVAGGKPQKQAVLDFIRWTLTEGQHLVAEAGYVPVSSEQINAYLKKLD